MQRDELSLIRTISKRREILGILQDWNPCHNDRKYLVHFLRGIGYSDLQILHIIDKLNQWRDYSPRVTEIQVKSLRTGINAYSIARSKNETSAQLADNNRPGNPSFTRRSPEEIALLVDIVNECGFVLGWRDPNACARR